MCANLLHWISPKSKNKCGKYRCKFFMLVGQVWLSLHWFLPTFSAYILYWMLSKLSEKHTKMSKISYTSIRKVQPFLPKFSWNSRLLKSIMCRFLIRKSLKSYNKLHSMNSHSFAPNGTDKDHIGPQCGLWVRVLPNIHSTKICHGFFWIRFQLSYSGYLLWDLGTTSPIILGPPPPPFPFPFGYLCYSSCI